MTIIGRPCLDSRLSHCWWFDLILHFFSLLECHLHTLRWLVECERMKEKDRNDNILSVVDLYSTVEDRKVSVRTLFMCYGSSALQINQSNMLNLGYFQPARLNFVCDTSIQCLKKILTLNVHQQIQFSNIMTCTLKVILICSSSSVSNLQMYYSYSPQINTATICCIEHRLTKMTELCYQPSHKNILVSALQEQKQKQ